MNDYISFFSPCPYDSFNKAWLSHRGFSVVRKELEEEAELAWLPAFYGVMMTEKQCEVPHMPCKESMSLGEIAQESGVSRRDTHDTLTWTARKLFDTEKKRSMARFRRMEDGLAARSDALKPAAATEPNECWIV